MGKQVEIKKVQVHQFMIWSTEPFIRDTTIDQKLVHQLMVILKPIFGFNERTLHPEILQFIRSKYGDINWNVLTIYIYIFLLHFLLFAFIPGFIAARASGNVNRIDQVVEYVKKFWKKWVQSRAKQTKQKLSV